MFACHIDVERSLIINKQKPFFKIKTKIFSLLIYLLTKTEEYNKKKEIIVLQGIKADQQETHRMV